MKIDGNQVILDKKAVSDWLCYELEQVHSNRGWPKKLEYHQDLIEGALGIIGVCPRLFQEIFIGMQDPTDENLFRAYQAVIREFGPSGFRFLANLGGERHAE